DWSSDVCSSDLLVSAVLVSAVLVSAVVSVSPAPSLSLTHSTLVEPTDTFPHVGDGSPRAERLGILGVDAGDLGRQRQRAPRPGQRRAAESAGREIGRAHV